MKQETNLKVIVAMVLLLFVIGIVIILMTGIN